MGPLRLQIVVGDGALVESALALVLEVLDVVDVNFRVLVVIGRLFFVV